MSMMTDTVWQVDDGPQLPGDFWVRGANWRVTLRCRLPVGAEVTVRGVLDGVAYSGRAIVVDCVTRVHEGQVLYDQAILEGIEPLNVTHV